MSAPARPLLVRRRGGRAARPARSLVLRVGLLLVLLQLLFRGWALSGSWFFFDDLAFMSAGMNDALDRDFVTRVYAGHVMPGGWLVVKGLVTVAAYQWPVWAGVLLALQAVAGVGMLRLLRSLFGDSPFVLALLAAYLFYVFTLPAGLWFAAGINQLPLQVALVFGLHAHVAYLRTRGRLPLVATLAWTAFGLAFYEKAAMLFLVYAIVALGWFARGSLSDRLRELWRHYRLGVVAHGLVAVPYVALYLTYGITFGAGDSTMSLLTSVAYRLVAVAFSTAAIGGPLGWRTDSTNALANPGDLVSLASWVALGALAWYAHRTRTLSRRAWWLIGASTVANVYLVSSARASLVGADIGLEYRYQTEAAALLVLSVGLAFLPLRGAPEVNEVREDADLVVERTGAVRAVTVVVVALALISSLTYVRNWQTSNLTKPYFDQVRAGLQAAEHQPVPLVDASLPQTLLWAFGFPENTYSHVFRDQSRLTTYPDWSVDELYIFDDAGRLSPVLVAPARSMVPTAGCGYVLQRHSPTSIPLDGPVIGGGWWIQMGYAAPRDFDVTVRLGATEHSMRLPHGFHTVYFRADGEYDAVRVENGPAGATACIDQLVLGLPAPTPAPA